MPKKGDDLRGKCKRNNRRRGGRWKERTKDEEVRTKEERKKILEREGRGEEWMSGRGAARGQRLRL